MADSKRTRVFFLGFPNPGVATYVLERIKEANKAKQVNVVDWAMIQKPVDGEVKITTNKSVDPGAARGAGFGGMAGVILAGISGPIGVGAIVGGAAVGAVTAALKDSGLKDDKLESISHLMAEGREGLVIVTPLDDGDAFQSFMDGDVDFQAADRRMSADIVPGRSLKDVIDDYIHHEED